LEEIFCGGSSGRGMLLVGFRLVMLLSYNGLCKSDIKTSENFVVVFWYVRVMYLLLRDT